MFVQAKFVCKDGRSSDKTIKVEKELRFCRCSIGGETDVPTNRSILPDFVSSTSANDLLPFE